MSTIVFPVFQSTYSLLQSTISLERMVMYAKENNIKHLTIADKNVLFGAIEFFQLATANDIVSHIGMQLDMANVNLLLIAKNNVGLANLQKLSSKINSYDFVFVDANTLLATLAEVIVIINEYDEAVFNCLKKLPTCDVFVQKNMLNEQQIDSESLPQVDFPIINCIEKTDRTTLHTLYAIDQNKEMTNIEQFPQAIYLQQQAIEVPHIIEHALVSYDFNTYHLPTFSPNKIENQKLFNTLCKKGLKKRYANQITQTHIDRLTHEMSVIVEMGFVDYFLIIWDVMRFARKEDIIIGPGRGSAVGSLVAYVLGITKMDPLAYGLLFERFLNTARKTMPDIDIDVEDGRRGEIISYLRTKYGSEHVANILTFGTFGAKSAIRDVAKAYNYDATKTTSLLKHITNSYKSIEANIQDNPNLQKIITTHTDVARIITTAQIIEGFPRHSSTHAAGIILTDEPIEQFVATIEPEANMLVTQATMYYCERIGLLKIDFLGLRNLTIIRQVATQVMQSDSVVHFIENEIPDGDEKTFNMLTTGETTGIFQLESSGMRQVLQKFKIKSFSDIAVVLALYRPGPMQFIDEYIARKDQKKKYEITLSNIEPILKETHGIMVYQEQVMQIAQMVGQMSLAEADDFRRAMSKKDRRLLQEQKDRFVQGGISIKLEAVDVSNLFDEIMAFASYGFNKSHALAYAQIAYQMAYLKVHYPAVFMVGLLNSVMNSEKKSFQYLQEAMRFGIKILPADINKSLGKYSTEQGHIRIGLGAIKSIGKITIQHILAERETAPYQSIADFLTRTDSKVVNTAVLDQLTNGYAFSSFSKNQKAIHKYLQVHEAGRKFQGEIIQIIDTDIPQDIDDYSLDKRREIELKAYGFALFAHPLLHYPKNQYSLTQPPKNYLSYIVYIEKVKEIKTKKGDKMAFATISDMREINEVVIFPYAYEQYALFLRPNTVVKMTLQLPKEVADKKANPSVTKIELLD